MSLTKTDLERFTTWLDDARRSEVFDPNAMSLATVDANGLPNLRVVLLKGYDARGFVFYTNLQSAKGRELDENPKAALCLHWSSLNRTIIIKGAVEPVPNIDADAYFQSRPRRSQIGAWASHQSKPLHSRRALMIRAALIALKYLGRPIQRPSHWGGFRVVPNTIEFHRLLSAQNSQRANAKRPS